MSQIYSAENAVTAYQISQSLLWYSCFKCFKLSIGTCGINAFNAILYTLTEKSEHYHVDHLTTISQYLTLNCKITVSEVFNSKSDVDISFIMSLFLFH